MKKILIISALALSLGSDVFAGYTANINSKCNWWTNRYKSAARISIGIPLCWPSNASCSGCYYSMLHPSCTKDCGFQEAWAGPAGAGNNGYISASKCSRGESISDLSAALLPPEDTLNNNDTIEASSSRFNSVVFNEQTHSVQIMGFSGRIKLNKLNGFLSKMRLAIWKPNHDVINHVEDVNMDENEILEYVEIIATDAGIAINGTLSNQLMNQATIVNYPDYTEIIFDNINFIVPINPLILIDDVSVRLDGDGAPDEQINLRHAQEATAAAINSKAISLTCMPNPTTNAFALKFNNINESGSAEISLFDAAGKKVKDIFNGSITQNQELNLNIDLSNLPAQIYTVYVKCNGRQYVEKIVKK